MLTICIFYVSNLAIIIKGRIVIANFIHELIESWRTSETCLGSCWYIPEQAFKPKLKNCNSLYTDHYLFCDIHLLSVKFVQDMLCYSITLMITIYFSDLTLWVWFLEGCFVTTLLGRYSLPVIVCLNNQTKIKQTLTFFALKWLAQYHAQGIHSSNVCWWCVRSSGWCLPTQQDWRNSLYTCLFVQKWKTENFLKKNPVTIWLVIFLLGRK